MAGRSKELIVRALVEVISGSVMPIRVWAPLVFSKHDSDFAMHARVTAFPILYGCIRDIAEAGHEKVAKIADEARLEGYGVLGMNAERFSERCNLARPILEMFDEDEQILLALLRDRLAHGYLNGTSNKTRSVKIIQDGKVVGKTFERDILTQKLKTQFPSDDLLDINPMINKVSNAFAEYVPKIDEYNVSVQELTGALMNDGLVIFEK